MINACQSDLRFVGNLLKVENADVFFTFKLVFTIDSQI